MGTATIPFSNPAGNNQTNPTSTAIATKATGTTMPGATGTSTAANPYVAPTSTMPTVAGVPTSGNTGGNLGKQLTDIYGAGVGGALSSELGSMSGTNSTALQQYIASLQPQMATAQANVNASLGAGGVSSNSSVAAIADANLQGQETAGIAQESMQLEEQDQSLTANILGSTMNSAEQETSTSGWTVFGDVMGSISQDAGAILHGGPGSMPGSMPGATPAATISSAPAAMPANVSSTDASSSGIGIPSTGAESDGEVSL